MWNKFDCFTADNLPLKCSSLNCKITRTANKDYFVEDVARIHQVPGNDPGLLKVGGTTNPWECWCHLSEKLRLGEGPN